MNLNQKRGPFTVERLTVRVFPDRREIGIAAGQAVAEKMRTLLKKRLSPVDRFFEEVSVTLQGGFSWTR
jgi:hypothetical protein